MANMDTGGASPAVLYRLAHAVASLKSSKFTTCVVQGGYATIGGASVVTPYTRPGASGTATRPATTPRSRAAEARPSMMAMAHAGFVFLSMPKAGSTAIQQHFSKHAQILFRQPPGMKHMSAPRRSRT